MSDPTDRGQRWDGAERTVTDQPTTTPAACPDAGAPAADGWHLAGEPGPLSGQMFGDYEIGGVLGEGGMGTVYRARQRSLGRRVAVKTLARNHGQDPVQRARFEIEARAASLIQSPHVVAVYAAGSWDGIAYFVMEYVAGSDLGAAIQAAGGGGLGHQRALDLVLQAARGLAAAASHGIVHRDIKPGNLLLTTDDLVKISDFGISLLGESHLTRTGSTVGTPSYLSPEQGRGETCDARSDIYSLGVVLYEALTGRKPFTGDSADAIIYQHNYAEPRPPRELAPTIPEPVQALCVRCLHKDPAKRYQSAQELIDDLERLRSGDVSITAVLQARYGTGAEEAMRRRLGRRHRWILPLAAGLILAGSGTVGLWWWQAGAENRAGARADAERRRERLRQQLDAGGERIPPGALEDVAALARVAGREDPDVQRWNARLERVTTLRQRLARLDDGDAPSAALRAEASQDLPALATLIGPDGADQPRWRARLAAAEEELAALRQRLGELDATAEATVAQRDRLAPALARLRRLAPADDGDLARWQRRLDALAARLGELDSALLGLDDPAAVLREDDLDRASTLLAGVAERRGTAPADAAETRRRTALAGHRAAIARLRDALGVLDAEGLPGEAALNRATADLATYRLRVAPDEARLLRWQARLHAATRQLAAWHEAVAALDGAATLPAARLEDGRAALAGLRPLVDGGQEALDRAATALAAADAAIAAWRGALATLEKPGPVPLPGRELAATAISELERRAAETPARLAAARERLAAEKRAFAELRARCARADDRATVISQALAEDVLLYQRLATPGNPDARRWRNRVIDYVTLCGRLAALERPAPLPGGVDADLAALARIVGAEDARLAGWQGKVGRVRALLAQLQRLDTVAPVADDAAGLVDELASLIGDFPQRPTWTAKIARVRTLEADCQRRLGPRAVRLDPEAIPRLDELAAAIGETAPVAAWRARGNLLGHPPRPAWAMEVANDRYGPRARLSLAASAGAPAVELAFRHLPPGEFTLGSPPDEPGRASDEHQVRVVLTRSCWIAETEVTQAAWFRVMGSRPWAGESIPDAPVERVAWTEAQAFCARLGQLVNGLGARLPSEAEWEYATRANDAEPDLDRAKPRALAHAAWYRATSEDTPHPVGRRPPNALGLFDLHGNVWEWCLDRYGTYPATDATDPVGHERDEQVARGGSWADPAEQLRTANRSAVAASTRSALLGFRIVVAP